MKRKLLLSFALATFTAVLTAGIVQARAVQLLDSGSAGVGIDLPNNTPLPNVPKPQLPRCADGADNDGDGRTDVLDSDCDAGSAQPPPPPPPPPPQPKPPGPGGDDGPGTGGTPPNGGGKKGGGDGGARSRRRKLGSAPTRNLDGTPTASNPTLSQVDFGPAPIGVSNFMIDQFEIPPFLLPIYQACGTQYGIPWIVLAAINKHETGFGRLADVVSSAGAVGWMQFLPSTWAAYGVDANGDGLKDPGNPVDAICAAARYLRAAGGETDLRGAIFAYNHADWYVAMVLTTARLYGKLPEDLVGSLTGLMEGAHFPVAANARYADDLSEREAKSLERGGKATPDLSSSPTRRGIDIFSRDGAPVVAVNDGVITKIGRSRQLGRYVVLQDAYGNQYTYAKLGQVARAHPVPKEERFAAGLDLLTPRQDKKPARPASAGVQPRKGRIAVAPAPSAAEIGGPVNTEDLRERLFALPQRPNNRERASLSGQLDDLLGQRVPAYKNFKNYFADVFQFDRKSMEMRPLRVGSTIVGGTVIARIGKTEPRIAPRLHFEIQPAGRGAPRIDPKPVLDVWTLLAETQIYRAAGKSPFTESDVGQVLLQSKETAIRRVLANPRLEIYSCGRSDIRTGQVDVRVLRLLQYLTVRGYRLTVTSLKCGHGFYTSTGNVSHHSSGNAVDIAQVNGVPILGHQGRGSITEAVIKDILQLQGTMEPAQVISLMTMGGPTISMGDHADHIHVGYQPLYGNNAKLGRQFVRLLRPDQWQRLIGRIAEIESPPVSSKPSRFAIPAKKAAGKAGGKRSSDAHIGE